MSYSTNHTLEEHLTDSIRRAKQKILNNAIQNLHQTPEYLLERLQYKNNLNAQSRNRANSVRYLQSQTLNHKQQNALAGAMKTLQSRIYQLQNQKRQLLARQKGQSQSSQSLTLKKNQNEEQLYKLKSILKEKQYEIKKLNRINSDLHIKNSDLLQKIQQLQESLGQIAKQSNPNNKKSDIQSLNQRYQGQLPKQNIKIRQLQQKIRQLQTRNNINHQTIQQLTSKIQQQKQINMKWIKLHESHLNQLQQKQNNMIISNQQQIVKIKQKQKRNINMDNNKKQLLDLKKNNKILYQKLNNNKHRMAQLSRQKSKQFQEKYNRIRLIAIEITEEVNKLIPNHNSHVKFLISKIYKLDNNHSESLRMYSNHMRKSRNQERSSQSRDRKRSLKMSDLNSSPKKSNQKSHSKSHRKIKVINEEPLSKSQKKQDNKTLYQQQINALQKQVVGLKKKYRNLIARKDKNNSQDFKIIQQVAQQYNEKKQKLQEMKKK